MKDDRNYIGYGKKNLNISWPNNAKLALQFVLNYEEGAENNILNGLTLIALQWFFLSYYKS